MAWNPISAVTNAVNAAVGAVEDVVDAVTGGSDKNSAPVKNHESASRPATASTPMPTTTVGGSSSTDVSKAIATALAEARRAETQAMAEARRTEAIERADAQRHESDNMLLAEKDSNLTMRYGIMKNSQDTQWQVLAWLTSQLEGLDTKTQIFMKDAEVRLAQIGSDYDIQKRQIRVEERELDLREHEIDRARMAGSDGLLAS